MALQSPAFHTTCQTNVGVEAIAATLVLLQTLHTALADPSKQLKHQTDMFQVDARL